MKFFKDREFDPSGLAEVLLNIGFTLLAIIIAIAFLCLCVYYPVVLGVSFAGICVLALVYAGLKTAFDLIFPKKVDKDKRLKELNDWLYRADNTFKKDGKGND
jgi:hypothetical protein